jgi:hypothetical protein
MHASLDRDNPQLALARAFADGLNHQFGPVLGGLLAAVVQYRPNGRLDQKQLTAQLETDAGAILGAVVAHHVDTGTLHLIRGNTIGCAILRDRAGVVRWATEGRNQSERTGKGWEQSAPQWQYILENPDRFIRYVHEVKTFQNQV